MKREGEEHAKEQVNPMKLVKKKPTSKTKEV
jgi:hypothetical protein